MPAAAEVNVAPISEQSGPIEMKNDRLSGPLTLQMRTREFTIRCVDNGAFVDEFRNSQNVIAILEQAPLHATFVDKDPLEIKGNSGANMIFVKLALKAALALLQLSN